MSPVGAELHRVLVEVDSGDRVEVEVRQPGLLDAASRRAHAGQRGVAGLEWPPKASHASALRVVVEEHGVASG